MAVFKARFYSIYLTCRLIGVSYFIFSYSTGEQLWGDALSNTVLRRLVVVINNFRRNSLIEFGTNVNLLILV